MRDSLLTHCVDELLVTGPFQHSLDGYVIAFREDVAAFYEALLNARGFNRGTGTHERVSDYRAGKGYSLEEVPEEGDWLLSRMSFSSCRNWGTFNPVWLALSYQH